MAAGHNAFERVLDAIAATTGHPSQGRDRQRKARCPAHEDRKASLSITRGTDRVLLKCHAGCDVDAILAAIRLTRADLFDEPKQQADTDEWTPCGHGIAAEYRYVDEHGEHLFTVVRCPRKDFAQWRPDATAKSGRRWKLDDTRRVLYRLPAVVKAVQDGLPIFIVEGEKDVHTLEADGLVATCNPHGAGKWRPEFAETLRGAVVTIVADRDPTGQKHAEQVRDSLLAVDADVTIVEAASGKDASDHVKAGHSLADLVQTWPEPKPATRLPAELDQFLAEDDPEYDWLVPGLIERGDRVILTGEEGGGKSTLLRQIGVQTASGIHPFGGDDFNPLSVLWLQLENSRRHERRQFRHLRKIAKGQYRGRLRIEIRTEGIDLLNSEHGQWLLDLTLAVKPDLLITGPIYKLANGDPTEERTAKTASMWLDRIRAEAGCAILLEAHVPYGSGSKHRPERPYGASLWSRWPEFGVFLSPTGQLRHWRGQRDERAWPNALHREGEWPWEPVTDSRDATWARMVEEVGKIDGQISNRALAKLIGVSSKTVDRIVKAHKDEWEKLTSGLLSGGDAP